MHIKLQEIVPGYFDTEQITGSEIWGKNIVFNKGEHVHIVAPSGSGKTSLIHFLYGLRKDYNGTISYQDENIKNFTLEQFSALRQKNLSIVFQDLRLFTEQTVRENIELKRQLNPYHSQEKIEEMAAQMGIQNKLNRLAKTCSYGEQQRIAIIRSLMQPFDFLLLDEPFSNLDEGNRIKAFELIEEECSKRNASMIFADLKELDFLKGQRILKL
jgi:putative ABC transport system ATP-binding protein